VKPRVPHGFGGFLNSGGDDVMTPEPELLLAIGHALTMLGYLLLLLP
jgi:hypothetical protein